MDSNQEQSDVTAKKDQSSGRPDSADQDIGTKPAQSSPIDIKKPQNKYKSTPGQSDQAGIMTDANGEPIPIDEIIKTANTMSSMMMAHKIALEDDFRLEPGMDISGPLMSLSPIIGSSSPTARDGRKREPSLQGKVKDIVHEAYWDLFKEEIDSYDNDSGGLKKYDISIQLLKDIKQKIIDLLLPQHSRLKKDIEDRLDLKILDHLCKIRALNPGHYVYYILDLLARLCAPVRDQKLKELREIPDLVQQYRGIMEMLELMRLDFANFTLDRFKPHIKAHSQDYEREKFNEILKQQQSIGIDGLEYTRIWIQRAVEHVDAQHGLKDLIKEANEDSDHVNNPEAVMTSNEAGTTNVSNGIRDKILRSDIVNRVMNTAYCELLEWTPTKQKLYPETLLFDESTFKQLGEQYEVLLLTSSILLTTFAFVSKFRLQDDQEFRTLAKSHVITLLTATYDSSTTIQTESDSGNKSTAQNQITDTSDQTKLDTVALRLIEDIRQKLNRTNKSFIETFENQTELLRRQIVDLQNGSNRIRELARRRILEFVDTLLTLDVEHQQKKFSSSVPPPVNIPLGLNCLADEITLTMAQLVKIIRYNRRVFFQHYQDIIVDLVSKIVQA